MRCNFPKLGINYMNEFGAKYRPWIKRIEAANPWVGRILSYRFASKYGPYAVELIGETGAIVFDCHEAPFRPLQAQLLHKVD